jgi:imidazolonepropionase-like amidohydrolase
MRTLYRDAALADARSPELLLEHAALVVDGRIEYLGPDNDAPVPRETRVIDAGGSTIVPGMVDAHSHVTLPGGSHWIARIDDDTATLLDAAEHNGDLMVRSGVRWARDVGSPRRIHPDENDERGLAVSVRDAWAGRRDRPYIRAAGTWITKEGTLPPRVSAEAADADALVAAVEREVESGTDLVKLYLDGPDLDVAPWTAAEVGRAVAVAAERGIAVTAHATQLAGARAAVEGGISCIEHGTRLDADLCRLMVERGTYLVPTLAVLASWEGFQTTTTLERFTAPDFPGRIAERRRAAWETLRLARAAGVKVAAGTDFGGGSLRANQLPWEIGEMARAGMEPWEALAAATWVGGELLGEPEAGVIREGGPADFFLVHGNPLEDPAALWRVWRVTD